MKIALIGWGPILRNRKALNISGVWQNDGPHFPLEFAYISKSRLLTLVINPASPLVQTFWALSEFVSLEDAKISLGKLTRSDLNEIGFFSKIDGSRNANVRPKIIDELQRWIENKRFDAVVWLDRKSNFEEITELKFSDDHAIDYVYELAKNERLAAENYVVSTPEQIETPVRGRLRRELGWRNLSVYKEGFWLDKNTFIMCDDVDIEMVARDTSSGISGGSETVPMLIMTNAVKMVVDNNNKILGEDIIGKFGLWLEDVKNLYMKQKLWLKDASYQ